MDFFKHIAKILNISGRALELAANIGTAAASRTSKPIVAIATDNMKFVHQPKGLYLDKILL